MTDKNLHLKLLLIVVVVGLLSWELYPPREKLKGGIDLVGGHVLLYEIDETGLDESQKRDLAERVMRVLRKRVDPKGQRNLEWVPIGRNRLEIRMPKPPKEAQQRRKQWEQAAARLKATNITRAELDLALSETGPARQAALDALVRGVPSRRALLAEAAKAYDAYQAARAGGSPKQQDRAFEQLEAAINRVLETNIDLPHFSNILAIEDKKERAKQLTRLRERYPHRVELLAQARQAYDNWAKNKGFLEDPSDLQRLLRGAGVLEFRILPEREPGEPRKYEAYIKELHQRGPQYRGGLYLWCRIADPVAFLNLDSPEALKDFEAIKKRRRIIIEKYADGYYVLAWARARSGGVPRALLSPSKGGPKWSLKRASMTRDELGRPAVNFVLDSIGGSAFYQLTSKNVKKPLCIVLDDQAISAPVIDEPIRESGIIRGDFTVDEVHRLVSTLEAGALPARLKEPPIMIKSVGPRLGKVNRERGLTAAKWGLYLVAAFMLFYYLHAGLIADIALGLNLIIVLGIMAMIQATFTLPGVAGIILTIGMAVDANVLIFERIREEIARGTTLRMAIRTGYEKAFSTILDANLTTLVTCVILGYFGSEEVKGFALTLGLGVATSMFTALFVTRQFFTVMILPSLSRQEVLYCWGGAGALAAFGAAMYELGRWLSGPNEPSRALGLGEYILFTAGAAVALVALMWGLRIVFRTTSPSHPGRVPMLRLLSQPKINWLAKRRLFWPVSAALAIGGIALFIVQPNDRLYDIEFLGGTSAQIELAEPMTDEQVRSKITDPQTGSPAWLRRAADAFAAATVTSPEPNTFQIRSPDLSAEDLETLLMTTFSDKIAKGGIVGEGHTIRVRTKPQANVTLAMLQAERARVAEYVRRAAEKFESARVQEVQEYGATTTQRLTFEVTTTETDKKLVRAAILGVFGPGQLVARQAVRYVLVKDRQRAPEGLFPIRETARQLGDVIGGTSVYDVRRFRGGLALVFDQLDPPQTLRSIRERLRDMRLQPDFEQYQWRDYDIVGLARVEPTTGASSRPGNAEPRYSRIAILVTDENFLYFDGHERWAENLARPELTLAEAALSSERSLQKVTQFAPQVAARAKAQAGIAIVLALAAIVLYIWIRFGNMLFGLAAIVALVHDLAISLGLVTASYFLYQTAVGQTLAITAMRIDLPMIAAFLTIIGYSLNDTIVVFDRIRENRGKLATLSPTIINTSINQTLSRTILTSLTTLLVVVVMYAFGGPGIHGFSFALIVGVVVGTYSSIGIASPLVMYPRALRVVLTAIITAALVGGLVATGSVVLRVILGVAAALVVGTWAKAELNTVRERQQLAMAR